MNSNGVRPFVGICVLVVKEGKILLGRRKGAHGAGQYSAPGGHLEHLESFHDCAAREVLEETGLEIGPLRFLLVRNSAQYAPNVELAFSAAWRAGDPEVREPDKVERWDWYDLDDLPIPLFALALRAIAALRNEGHSPTCEDLAGQKIRGEKPTAVESAPR